MHVNVNVNGHKDVVVNVVEDANANAIVNVTC